MRSPFLRFGAVLVSAALASAVVGVGTPERADAQQAQGNPSAPPAAAPLPVVTKVLVIESSLRSLRSAISIDPIEHAIATGTFVIPTAGLVVPATGGTSADIGGAGEPKPAAERTWRSLEAKPEATPAPPGQGDAKRDPTDPGTQPVISAASTVRRFEDGALSGGYAFASVESPTRRVVILEASGHRLVYVSRTDSAGGVTWEPHVGDIYENGAVRVPIVLEAGTTHLLFRAGRGGLSIGFREAPARAFVEQRDATLPNILRDAGEIGSYLAGVQVTNPTESAQRNLGIRATIEGTLSGWSPLVTLPPLSVTKVPIEFPALLFGAPWPDKVTLKVELVSDGSVVHEQTFALDVRSKNDKHTRTFRSGIDGSVQYFAVVPPSPPAASNVTGADKRLALILSLHGASVEATSQAGAYAPKDWAWIVCPTNRRPFGFDWEDWGRLDAMEVLEIAERLFRTDPRRTYLTGHSMGGHGTWQLGVTYPGRWAAIAPSAGWPDFWSYTGAGEWPGDDAPSTALRRGSAPSRTLELIDRLATTPIYILHGDKDDNVPVKMAQLMKEKLATHSNLVYHEQPGAGHWWGNECVDWPPLMDFLKAHTLAADPPRADVPISAGGFKDAFRRGSVLVYGTHGSPEENAWALAKARFDSETFMYRGNASLRVMSDDEFLVLAGHAELGAVLYGNERTNSAWAMLADTTQLSSKVGPGAPHVAMVGIVPRRDGPGRVGLVGGADLVGMRLTTQMPYFVSGVAYPDWFTFGPEALLTGIRGVRSAGWFSDESGSGDRTR